MEPRGPPFYSRRLLRPEKPEMNLFQEHAVRDYAAAAAQIPVIDFGPCFVGEPGALERTAAVMRQACENVGFFYAANPGVPEALIDAAVAASRRVPALP